MSEPKGLLDDFFDKLFSKETTVMNLNDWNCVKKSIYDAKNWEAMTGQPVKIAVSKIIKTPERDEDHTQAVAIDGESLIPLTSHNADGKVRPWNWHYPDKEPYEYKDVDQFISEQKEMGNLDKEFLDYIKGIK